MTDLTDLEAPVSSAGNRAAGNGSTGSTAREFQGGAPLGQSRGFQGGAPLGQSRGFQGVAPLDQHSAAVKLRGVTKSYSAAGYRVTALDAIDLRIDAGAAVAVTGPSGSGKSTLLHLIGAMDRPDTGEIEVAGVRVDARSGRGLDEYRRRVGFVFQAFHLLPVLSVLDNVLAPVLPRSVEFDKVARARELIAAVGLAGRERAVPGELSGGQQQRIAIARAMICHPRVLLADEPTGNLDSSTGSEIVDLLLRLRESHRTTLIVATHNIEVAASCDRVVIMHDGHVVGDEQVAVAEAGLVLDRIGQLRQDG